MAENCFGYNPRQLNLMAIRLIQTFAEQHPALEEDASVSLNVAQEDGEVFDIPVQQMSPKILTAFVVPLVSTNNAALTAQLRDLGLEPPSPPDIQPMTPTDL